MEMQKPKERAQGRDTEASYKLGTPAILTKLEKWLFPWHPSII